MAVQQYKLVRCPASLTTSAAPPQGGPLVLLISTHSLMPAINKGAWGLVCVSDSTLPCRTPAPPAEAHGAHLSTCTAQRAPARLTPLPHTSVLVCPLCRRGRVGKDVYMWGEWVKPSRTARCKSMRGHGCLPACHPPPRSPPAMTPHAMAQA